MKISQIAIGAIALAGVLAVATPASAMTVQECSAKYKAAQAAGTIKGTKWADFRKNECGLPPVRAAAKPESAPVTVYATPWGAPTVGSSRPAN